jgi:hypothetical protein
MLRSIDLSPVSLEMYEAAVGQSTIESLRQAARPPR